MSDTPNWTQEELARIATLGWKLYNVQNGSPEEDIAQLESDNALLREFVDAARDELALVIGDERYTPSDRKPRERAKRTTDAYAALMAAGVLDR